MALRRAESATGAAWSLSSLRAQMGPLKLLGECDSHCDGVCERGTHCYVGAPVFQPSSTFKGASR